MPILQEAQEIYGYLPPEVQRIIALETGTPAEEIYGIVTFYSQFKLNPSGEVAISICLGTACYVKGAGTSSKRCQSSLVSRSAAFLPTADSRSRRHAASVHADLPPLWS